MNMDQLRKVLDEALRSVLTTRGRGEVMSRIRPVIEQMLDEQAVKAAALDDLMHAFREEYITIDDSGWVCIDGSAAVSPETVEVLLALGAEGPK